MSDCKRCELLEEVMVVVHKWLTTELSHVDAKGNYTANPTYTAATLRACAAALDFKGNPLLGKQIDKIVEILDSVGPAR